MSLIDDLKKKDICNIYADEMPVVIKEFLRDEFVSEAEVNRYWVASVKYIEDYTGLERERLEEMSDAVQAMLAIIADMHDKRSYTTEISYVNQLIENILGLHSENLL